MSNNPNDIYAKYFVKKEEINYTNTEVVILREAEPRDKNEPKITNGKKYQRFNPNLKQVVRLEEVEPVKEPKKEIEKTPIKRILDKDKVRELIEREHWQISDVAEYFGVKPQRIFKILADF